MDEQLKQNLFLRRTPENVCCRRALLPLRQHGALRYQPAGTRLGSSLKNYRHFAQCMRFSRIDAGRGSASQSIADDLLENNSFVPLHEHCNLLCPDPIPKNLIDDLCIDGRRAGAEFVSKDYSSARGSAVDHCAPSSSSSSREPAVRQPDNFESCPHQLPCRVPAERNPTGDTTKHRRLPRRTLPAVAPLLIIGMRTGGAAGPLLLCTSVYSGRNINQHNFFFFIIEESATLSG